MLEALQSNHRQEMAAQIPDKLGPVAPPVGQGSSLADPIIIIIEIEMENVNWFVAVCIRGLENYVFLPDS